MTIVPTMDFRGSKFVNEDGTLSEVAQSVFDALQTYIVKNLGNEGLVASTQSSDPANNTILQIQNNTLTSPTGTPYKTCQFGTFLYNSYTGKQMVTVNPGGGVPIFKNILTD